MTTWQWWPDSVCMCIEKRCILQEPPSDLDKHRYGFAKVWMDFNLQECKELKIKLEQFIADYEAMEKLCEENDNEINR